MNYVFRYKEDHIFLTADDPDFRYEVLCGYCEYPVEKSERTCPRCQRDLEDCPVCRRRRHRKAWKTPVDPSNQAETCPLCSVTRIPFSRLPLGRTEGAFCTNLYGCPAGGLLLASEHFAVLAEDSVLCPVCRHPRLTPAPVVVFPDLVSRCLACNTMFGKESSWTRGWAGGLASIPSLGTPSGDSGACKLCGRNDQVVPLSGGGQRVVSSSVSELALRSDGEEGLSLEPWAYLRAMELARALALLEDDAAVAKRIFREWFPAGPAAEGGRGERSVKDLVHFLEAGTIQAETRAALSHRLGTFLERWKQSAPQGACYKVRPGVEHRPHDC